MPGQSESYATMRVRAASIADAAAIAGISVRAWRVAYRGLMPDALLRDLSVERRTENWSRHIETAVRSEERVWILECEELPIGFASTGPSRDADAANETMEMYAIYLEPERVGHGLGARLFRHAVEDLRDRGAREVTLWALDGNARGARFYERMGMRRDGEKIETVIGAALPHVRYRLEIRET